MERILVRSFRKPEEKPVIFATVISSSPIYPSPRASYSLSAQIILRPVVRSWRRVSRIRVGYRESKLSMKPEPIVCCPLDSTIYYCSFFLILLSTLMYTVPRTPAYIPSLWVNITKYIYRFYHYKNDTLAQMTGDVRANWRVGIFHQHFGCWTKTPAFTTKEFKEPPALLEKGLNSPFL